MFRCLFSFSELNVENVHKIVSELNNSRSTTLSDVLPISVNNEHWIVLGSIIAKKFNLCLRRGIFPNKSKTAKIICIHKGGAHDFNYN